MGNKAGDKVSSRPVRWAGQGGLPPWQPRRRTNCFQPGSSPLSSGRRLWRGDSGKKGRSRLLLILSLLCLQTETPWAPSTPSLWARPPATMTHPRTATSLDTMTCLLYGIPRHPHLSTGTTEGPRWCTEASTPVLVASGWGQGQLYPARSRERAGRP